MLAEAAPTRDKRAVVRVLTIQHVAVDESGTKSMPCRPNVEDAPALLVGWWGNTTTRDERSRRAERRPANPQSSSPKWPLQCRKPVRLWVTTGIISALTRHLRQASGRALASNRDVTKRWDNVGPSREIPLVRLDTDRR